MSHGENGVVSSRIPTARLADYFVVVGYRNDGQKGALGSGVILQRFPTKDWEDAPFISEIELFCQPQGWSLSSSREEPRFFVSVLTDMNGNRHYCACLSFHEPISIAPSKPVDEEEDVYGESPSSSSSYSSLTSKSSGMGDKHFSLMYAPKCLVLMSRLNQVEIFRNCLGTIYTAHSEGLPYPIESLVGNLLGQVEVPLSGSTQIRFSIGGGDRQVLQPPLNHQIPISNQTVASLFHQLGVNNALVLFSAVMTEQKILFHSRSLTRLTDACHALTTLMFPFRYSHVYVPLLPSSIMEVACSPTPFIIGVHSSAQREVADLMDVILADLDGGSLIIPDGLSVPALPDVLLDRVKEELSLVLHPDLYSADFAFLPLAAKKKDWDILDKEIRAVFLRMFAILFQSYRTCLVIIRIHPKAVIQFHRSKFLGQRVLTDSEFVIRLLDSMFFNLFVMERGYPWRPCDIWDELYNEIPEKIRLEELDSKLVLQHIQELAQLLYQNENPVGSQQYIPKPPDGAHLRIHVKPFPTLNSAVIQEIVNEGIGKQALARYSSVSKQNQPRIVPFGSKACQVLDHRHQQVVDNSARRLEVLRTCIAYIFDNKITDARKSFHAVIRALKSHSAKLVLCQELGSHITGAKAVLNVQQFDMVVKLMHCALQDCSVMDEYGIAAALLPLACDFYRKLCNNVKQFAYTCIQEHPVWRNQQFWESVFYIEVEKEIKKLYLPQNDFSFSNSYCNNNQGMISSSISRRGSVDVENLSSPSSPTHRPSEYSALEIAAEQMRLALNLDSDKKKNLKLIEESTIVAQAVHFLSRMTYMLVPLDTPTRRTRDSSHLGVDEERASNITSMGGESDSLGAESGFEDQDPSVENGSSVKKFIGRFIDKVCTEGDVSEDHIRRTHAMISTCVDMHIEDCENVYKETKRLPPVQKPKIPNPNLLPGEVLLMDSIRVYLLPDGREDGAGGILGGPVILPAEGALFFTNYRLIFKGTPCDPYACEQTVIRSFPIASLTKEKRITVQYLAHLDQLLQEGLQLRSATFQLIKLAFDEEVGGDSIDQFRKMLSKARHPPDISGYFAFAGQQLVPAQVLTQKDKNTTLKGITKKMLYNTAKRAGLKPKPNKRQKYIFQKWGPSGNGGTLPAAFSRGLGSNNGTLLSNQLKSPSSRENLDGDDVSLSDDEFPHSGLSQNAVSDSKSVEKLMERSYYKDWKRMGLGTLHKTVNHNASNILSKAESFRISFVNCNYTLCRSYPALLVVPNLISEESVKKVARCYRGGRFPVITWKHPRTRALLVRGASFNSKGLMAFLKGHPHHGGGGASETTAHVEHENFLRAVVNATPMAVMKPGSSWMSDSMLSLDSISLYSSGGGGGAGEYQLATPDTGRKGSSSSSNPFAKAINHVRYAAGGGGGGGSSGGKGIYGKGGWSNTFRSRGKLPPLSASASPSPSTTGQMSSHGPHQVTHPLGCEDASETCPSSTATNTPLRIQKAALYVFGEKSQIKGMKGDQSTKIEYVPVDFSEVRALRTSFKKLMRTCLPSGTESETNFLRAIEGTEWLQQLSNLMWLSAAVVDLIDEGSSVILCLEDGSDITAQITSLAQLCLDPYYRTLEGFITLVEKEWLAFGHRFSHRNNATGFEGPSSNAGLAPVFLQFLDVCHQLLHQFPLSFEFNQYFLKFLAYHSVSGRFRTFLVDNEWERVELGFMAMEDKRGSLPRAYKLGVSEQGSDEDIFGSGKLGSSSGHGHTGLGQSVFEYIERTHAKSCIFYNFKYDRSHSAQVLRPMRHISALRIWDYYTGEELGTGATYDVEVACVDGLGEEEPQEGGKDIRKVVMVGYNLLDHEIPDSFRHYLSKYHQLEQDKGMLPQKWKQVWDKLEPPVEKKGDEVGNPMLKEATMIRRLGRSMHKKSTVDILVRGKLVRSDLSNILNHTQHHRYERHTFTTLTHCDTCSAILLGKTGLKCSDCGVKCHERCAEGVPKCKKNVGGGGVGGSSELMLSSGSPRQNLGSDTISVSSRTPSLQNSVPSYEGFRSNVMENRTHEGHLYKRGALLKGWKQRWFVLDSDKHQLRYYDAMEDSHFKGFIELSEVVNVTSGIPAPQAPKKADERCFFDIRTTRRVYNFCASDAASAQEWIEKIQACL